MAASKKGSEVSFTEKRIIKMISTNEELDSILAANQMVVVDFMASWCGPCKIFGPKYKVLSEEAHMSSVAFCACDVDEGEEVAVREGIMVMPTIIIYKDGVKYTEIKGANINLLIERLGEAMPPPRGASVTSLSPKTSSHHMAEFKAARPSSTLEAPVAGKRKLKPIYSVRELEAMVGGGVAAVAFTQPWAGTQFGPQFREAAAAWSAVGVRFCVCDCEVAGDVAAHVGVAAMPAVVIYKNGVKVSEIQGTKMELFLEQLSAIVAAAKLEGIVLSSKSNRSGTATSQKVHTSLSSSKVSKDFPARPKKKETLDLALPPPMEMLPIAMDPDVLAATRPIEPMADSEISKKGKAGIKLSGKTAHIQRASAASKASLSKSKPMKTHYNIPKMSKTG